MKLYIAVLFILNVIFECASASELYVLQHPNYLSYDFDSKTPIKLSEFVNILGATLGVNAPNVDFDGIKTNNTLKHPRVTLVVLTDEPSDLYGPHFKLIDEPDSSDFKSLTSKLLKDKKNVLFDSFDSLADARINVNSMVDTCKNKNNKVLVHVIDAKSKEGDDVNDKVEASDVINQVDKILDEHYKSCDSKRNHYLVYVLSTVESTKKVARDINKGTVSAPQANITNPAVFYSTDYPATFNIFFWLALAIALAVTGGSCILCNMDPGTDTVIYRMTSQRIKKDQ